MNTMKIQGIALSEFNDKAGFQLIMTIPQQSILTKQQFNLCSDLILPKQELCERIIAIQFRKDYFLLGMPSLSTNKSDDKKYFRQKYIYTVSLLIRKQDYLQLNAKQNLYKQIIRKLAFYFKFLQQSYHLIYDHKSSMEYIKKLLTKIFSDINHEKRCFLNHLCSHYTFINLNYSSIRQDFGQNQQIKDCEIPLTNLTIQQIQNHIQSQLGKKLLRYAYDGQYTIKKITDQNKQYKTQIKLFYKKAICKGLVFMVDMFSLNNTYVLTDKIHQFIGQTEKSQIMNEIKKSVLIQPNKTNEEGFDQNQLLFLYCQFNRLMTVNKIISQHKSLFQKINVIKFIRLGIILGILKRVHQHVLYYDTCSYISLDELRKLYRKKTTLELNFKNSKIIIQDQQKKLNDLLIGHLNNNDSLDQICVSLQMDYDTLLKILSPGSRHLFSFPQ